MGGGQIETNVRYRLDIIKRPQKGDHKLQKANTKQTRSRKPVDWNYVGIQLLTHPPIYPPIYPPTHPTTQPPNHPPIRPTTNSPTPALQDIAILGTVEPIKIHGSVVSLSFVSPIRRTIKKNKNKYNKRDTMETIKTLTTPYHTTCTMPYDITPYYAMSLSLPIPLAMYHVQHIDIIVKPPYNTIVIQHDGNAPPDFMIFISY